MGLSILGYEEECPTNENETHQEVQEERRHGSSQRIMTTDDDVREDTCSNSQDPTSSASTTMNEPPYPNLRDNSSILGDMTLFRDFFLAAFSDYNVASCCGGDTLFDDRNPVTTDRSIYASAKIPPPSSEHSSSSCYYHQHNHHHHLHHPMFVRSSPVIGRTTSSLSQNSTPAIQNNSSLDSKRRQRPLAVAVGFKYAEDMNGRPIIITPGNRRMPIRAPGGSSPSSSPSSHSLNFTRKEMAPNVLFPHEQEAKKGPALAYKPNEPQNQGVPQLPAL